MAKDAYYFSHDSNAHQDPKCLRLRRLSGLAGYGLYWCVIEMLRDAESNRIPLSMIDDIVYELRAEPGLFDALFSTQLLDSDGEYFWSNSLNRRMEAMREKSGKAVMAAKKGAEKRSERSANAEQTLSERSANAEQTLSERSANAEQTLSGEAANAQQLNKTKGNETKEKESKPKEITSALPEYSEDFLSFWSLYPRRIEKAAAWKAWNTRIKEGHDPKTIIEGAKRYADDVKRQKTEERFIKHPSTFLGPTTPFVEWSEKEVQEDEDEDDYYRITECSFLTAEERAAERAKKEKAAQAK